MTAQPPVAPRDTYSPRTRTALVLTGSGTAGAYHAGVLRAFQEAGVKIDLVAGTGMGVASAMFAAIDGSGRLWDRDGLWRRDVVSRFYRVRPALRALAWALAASWALALLPFIALALGLLVYPVGFVIGVAGNPGGSALAGAYTALVARLFDPAFLPAVLPRALVVALAAFVAVAGGLAVFMLLVDRRARRDRAPFWWRLAGAPLSAEFAVAQLTTSLWRLLGGAAGARQPRSPDLSRIYAELLRENLGQPGFRELLLTVHDLDMRRDFVFALIGDRYRRDFFRPAERPPGGRPVSELFDLAGVARDHVIEVLDAALRLPVGTEAGMLRFPAESYWCGEQHRAVERPGAVDRLLDELPAAGIEQVIVVSASPEVEGPHRLHQARGDWRGRLGDFLAGVETTAVRHVLAGDRGFRATFAIRPAYNPIGPLDMAGCYDERSDRRVPLGELVDRGYEDAYRQFIDPVVGAGGERLEAVAGQEPSARVTEGLR
ncbi:MAG TPA: patatin-like phospholipase family protein [Vicinamibacterales bacterium]|nr:patatin-like phospholipase family protein [Vicinamibacterales bacterium]